MALTPFSSLLIADTGISTGDEGKGRLILEIIDELRESTGNPDAVAAVMKVNGGSNSGHSVADVKLNLIPGGVVDTTLPHLLIGCGVVADPRKFLWEAAYAELHGYPTLSRLRIDERTLVSDLSHRLLDLAWEDYRVHVLKEEPRGSTGRGITPAYTDEIAQFQITYADFRSEKAVFARKVRARADRAVRVIEHVCQLRPERWPELFDTLSNAETRANKETIDAGIFAAEEFDFRSFKGPQPFTLNVDLLVDAYWEAGQKLVACVTDVREIVLQSVEAGRSIIGEFGQAYWLDKRHGFPPNVTASHTFTPEFFQSAGIPSQPVHTIGCCKAYDTKVGTHVFLTELTDEHPLGRTLRRIEFGSTTGRQRMVGWFDAVEKGDALRYGGYQDLALNKLDALSYGGDWTEGELAICVAYEAPDGTRVSHVPRDDAFRRTLKPVYKTLPGWSEDLSGIRHYADLPAAARRYVAEVMAAIVNIAYGDNRPAVLPNLRYIGVGPLRSQIIKDVPSTGELLSSL
ncbi:adenylosuccinate synthase [Spartobacteria bacterium LR76]|nr:adenylosuccinate synthase [Spartobacteria bacterium LR76]